MTAPTLITHLSWGRMEITLNGQVLPFKDCKIWPGGATEWDWRLTGTRHQPGIQPADIEEILAQGVEVMILSRGMDLMLHTCPETEDLLRAKGIEYFIEETKQAAAHFNQLMEVGKKVGGFFTRRVEQGDRHWRYIASACHLIVSVFGFPLYFSSVNREGRE